MINQLEENLEKFNPTEMWKPHHYQWLADFLEKEDYRKIFFWVDEKDGIMINYQVPAKLTGKHP